MRRGGSVMLRGVNLGGDCKVPYPNGGTNYPSDFSDHRTVSFVGRPFPLARGGRAFHAVEVVGDELLAFADHVGGGRACGAGEIRHGLSRLLRRDRAACGRARALCVRRFSPGRVVAHVGRRRCAGVDVRGGGARLHEVPCVGCGACDAAQIRLCARRAAGRPLSDDDVGEQLPDAGERDHVDAVLLRRHVRAGVQDRRAHARRTICRGTIWARCARSPSA